MRDAVARGLAASAGRITQGRAAVTGTGDLAAVKQMRVGTRRLRSALQLFAPVLDETWTVETRAALQSLADPLGVVRDTDVRAQRLRTTAADSPLTPPSAGVDAMVARLEADREVALTSLRADLSAGRWSELLDRLPVTVNSPPMRPNVDEFPSRWAVRGLVDVRWHRLRRRARALHAAASDGQLHELRIAVKRCRYAILAADSDLGDAARLWSSALADLQDVLGEHQDAVVTMSWCNEQRSGPGARAAAMLAVVEAYRARAATLRWPDAWRAAERTARWRWL